MHMQTSAMSPEPLTGLTPVKIESEGQTDNTAAENQNPRRKYRGVTYHRKNNKWVAQASVNGKSKYLGTHPTPERAARVYDAFVISTFGKSVKTNFPVNEVDFSLLPRLRTYKKPQYVDFTMLGLNPMFGQGGGRKDPNRPKHPKNAYLQFAAEQRRLMKESGRSFVGRGNMHKLFSEQWNLLSEEDKGKYITMAQQDRVRYEKEMENYSDPEAYSWMHTADAFHWLQPGMPASMPPGMQDPMQPGMQAPMQPGLQNPMQSGMQSSMVSGLQAPMPAGLSAGMPPVKTQSLQSNGHGSMPFNPVPQQSVQIPSFPESMMPKAPSNPGQSVVMPPGFMSLLSNSKNLSGGRQMKPISLPSPHTPLVIRDDSGLAKIEKVEAHNEPAPML